MTNRMDQIKGVVDNFVERECLRIALKYIDRIHTTTVYNRESQALRAELERARRKLAEEYRE